MAEEQQDETANTELQKKILELQSDKARKWEGLQRLHEKKKALQDEARQRQEDLEKLQHEINSKRIGEGLASRQDNKQDEAVGEFMQRTLREELKAAIPQMAESAEEQSSDEEGIDPKSKAEGEGEQQQKQQHDSVLVEYIAEVPGEQDKRVNYYVTYRIDKDTTVEALHRDACDYWGCLREEFKICRIRPHSDKLVYEVCEPPEKQLLKKTENENETLLPTKERAQLYLVQEKLLGNKDIDLNPRDYDKKMEQEKEEKANFLARAGQVQERVGNDEAYASTLSPWPGVYNLLKDSSRNHLAKSDHIKLRDIVIYVLLAFVTILAIYSRSRTNFFWMRYGIEHTVLHSPATSTEVLDFDEITQFDQIWTWLDGNFKHQIMDETSTLRQFYTPVGRLRLRHQKAASRGNKCRREEVPFDLTKVQCYYVQVRASTQEKHDQVVPNEWLTPGSPGRDTSPNPLLWQDTREDDAGAVGFVQSWYDGSGYKVDYDLQNASTPTTWSEDLVILSESWVDSTTRLLTAELLLANFHMGPNGGFISCMFMFEIAASGAIKPTAVLLPLNIGDDKDGGTAALILDIIRLIFIIYILLVKTYSEITYKYSISKSGLTYIFSFKGFIDMSTIAIFFAMGYMRAKYDTPHPYTLTKFYSYSWDARVFEQLFVAEAVFFVLLMIRLAAYVRMAPSINQYWKMFAVAFNMMMYYCWIFVPIFLSLVVLALAIWTPYSRHFSSWFEAIVTCVFLLKQDVDIGALYEKSRYLTIPYMIVFYFVMVCFLVHGFLAIMAHSYFEVQLTSNLPKGQTWSKDQWLKWVLWQPINKRFNPRGFGQGDEDEDDGRYDDDDDDDADEEKED